MRPGARCLHMHLLKKLRGKVERLMAAVAGREQVHVAHVRAQAWRRLGNTSSPQAPADLCREFLARPPPPTHTQTNPKQQLPQKQAYGARDYAQVGVTLQRGVCVNQLAATVVAWGLWAGVGPLLVAVGQDGEIARLAMRYLRLCTPALYCHALDTCLVRFLLVQGVTRPQFIATGVGTALAPAYLWLFVGRLGWGLDGAAAAYCCAVASMTAGNVVIVLLRVGVLLRGRPEACWPGLSPRAALRGWRSYLRYALPSWGMVSLEWCACWAGAASAAARALLEPASGQPRSAPPTSRPQPVHFV